MNSIATPSPTSSFHLKTSSLTDCNLVDAAKSGQEWAYAELVKRHSHKMYCTVFRITKNPEDTEDVIQIAILNAFRKIHQFDSRARFSTWLTKIAINSALMLLRKRYRHHEISMCGKRSVGDAWVEWDWEDIHAPDPERAYLKKEMNLRLRSAVERLPSGYRSLARLQLSEEKSVKELGDILGISTAAAKSRMLRAKTLLRSELHGGRNRTSIPQHAASLGG